MIFRKKITFLNKNPKKTQPLGESFIGFFILAEKWDAKYIENFYECILF